MKRQYVTLGSVGVIVLIVLGLLWHRAAQNPQRVFWDMLSNNLSTSGVTRVVSQQTSSLSINQYTQLNLGKVPSAHALTIFKQNGGELATEEISNGKSDYVRYQKITTQHSSTSKPLNVSSIVGKWAKLSAGDSLSGTVSSGLFDQSLLGVLPIANLDANTRANLLDTMHTSGVFSFDPAKVKTIQLDGRRTYQYSVTIKAAAYVALMQKFEKLVGSTQYASLDPNSYAASATIPVTLSVDTRSHHLSQLYQASGGHMEQYKAFGVSDDVPLPKATLTTTQLEQRLASLGQAK